MAKPIKYVATHGDKTYTRSSHRVYTHAVLTRRSQEHAFNQIKVEAQWCANNNYEYFRREAANPTYPHSESAMATMRQVASLTREGYIAKREAELLEQHQKAIAAGKYTTFTSNWCGRLDLAEKLANLLRNDPANAEVIIVTAFITDKV